jgi:hypothetical protein
MNASSLTVHCQLAVNGSAVFEPKRKFRVKGATSLVLFQARPRHLSLIASWSRILQFCPYLCGKETFQLEWQAPCFRAALWTEPRCDSKCNRQRLDQRYSDGEVVLKHDALTKETI